MKKSLKVYVQNLIREHARQSIDGYHLFISDLPIYDKKIFLSHLVHPCDYECFYDTPEGIAAAVMEYSDEMQGIINQLINELYSNDMQEKGLRINYSDNGEMTWTRVSGLDC